MGNEPVKDKGIFVIFGFTGDLAKRKLVPALYSLYSKGILPEGCRVAGVGRRALGKANRIQPASLKQGSAKRKNR